MTEGIATPGTPAYEKILEQMVSREQEIDRGLHSPQWRQATVVAISNAEPSVSIYLGGDTDTQIDGVKFLHTYRPRVNDQVWIMQNGSDLVIVGTTTLPPAQGIYTSTVDSDLTTGSTTYVDLSGPSLSNIWFYAGQEFKVELIVTTFTVSTDNSGLMTFDMSGASTLAKFDTNAAWTTASSNSTGYNKVGHRSTRVTAGATGLHNFKCWYREGLPGGGSITFSRSRMIIHI